VRRVDKKPRDASGPFPSSLGGVGPSDADGRSRSSITGIFVQLTKRQSDNGEEWRPVGPWLKCDKIDFRVVEAHGPVDEVR